MTAARRTQSVPAHRLDVSVDAVLTDAMDTTTSSPDGAEAKDAESERRSLTKDGAADLGDSRRGDRTDEIMADAEKRDEKATIRDAVSDERARVADREAFTNADEKYSGHGERRAAALDRAGAKNDRESSADDREYLAHDRPDPTDPTDGGDSSEDA